MPSRTRNACFDACPQRPAASIRSLLLLLLLPGVARVGGAQTPDSTSVSPNGSTVTDKAGGFPLPPTGLPPAELETYNVSGTVERLYFGTSHAGK